MRNRQLVELLTANENGSAIMQVMMLSVFIMITAYALSDFLGFNDNNSRKLIDRTIYMNAGSETSDYLSNPNSSNEAQAVSNVATYE